MYTVEDWLDTHGLDIDSVDMAIAAIKRLNSIGALTFQGSVHSEKPLPNWRLKTVEQSLHEVVAPAIFKVLDLGSEQILIASKIEIQELERSKYQLPSTENRGSDHCPLISINWNATPEDLICLAHEAAHAIQINLSDRKLSTPLSQEICAFIGELAIIEALPQNQSELSGDLHSVWNKENCKYFGEDLMILKEQCQTSDGKYLYQMNYPLARYFALQLFREGDSSLLREVFTRPDDWLVRSHVERLADLADGVNNHLPQLSPSAKQETYRSLGIMTALDASYPSGECDRSIGDYYTERRASLENDTALITVGSHRKPVGYVNWLDRQDLDNNPLKITRQSAPFGDHLHLMKHFENHIGSVAVGASSCHIRSAREVQQAW